MHVARMVVSDPVPHNQRNKVEKSPTSEARYQGLTVSVFESCRALSDVASVFSDQVLLICNMSGWQTGHSFLIVLPVTIYHPSDLRRTAWNQPQGFGRQEEITPCSRPPDEGESNMGRRPSVLVRPCSYPLPYQNCCIRVELFAIFVM